MRGSYDASMPRNPLLFLAVITAACGIANADPVDFTVSGDFSTSDTAGTLVAPGGAFVFNFEVDSTSTSPSMVDSLGFDVAISDFSYTLNGVAVDVEPTEIRFNTLANGGLFDVTFGSLAGAPEFDLQGDQAFGGSTNAPTFAPETYSVSSVVYSDDFNYDTTLSANVTSTPEPSTFLPLFGGLLALVALSSRKLRRAS
jgi:hypothetical protein